MLMDKEREQRCLMVSVMDRAACRPYQLYARSQAVSQLCRLPALHLIQQPTTVISPKCELLMTAQTRTNLARSERSPLSGSLGASMNPEIGQIFLGYWTNILINTRGP